MLNRCYNRACKFYRYYGGRGISVYGPWRESFSAFLDDVGPRPTGMSLDRIDNDRDYEPGNVRWVTSKTQARNRRNNRLLTIGGHTQCLSAWAEEASISLPLLRWRLAHDRSPDELLRLAADKSTAARMSHPRNRVRSEAP